MWLPPPSVEFYSTQDTSVLPQSNLCPNFMLFIYSFAIPHLLRSSWIHVLLCFHRSQVGSSPSRDWQCLCDISKAMQGQSLYCLLFTSGPATPNFGSRLTRDMWFVSPDTTAESWAEPLPLEGDDVDRVPATLRAPGQAARVLWHGTARNRVTSNEEKVFLSPFHCLQQLSYLFPPHPACFWPLPCPWWQLWSTLTKDKGFGRNVLLSAAAQKGQWPEVPLCLTFAKKNKWI